MSHLRALGEYEGGLDGAHVCVHRGTCEGGRDIGVYAYSSPLVSQSLLSLGHSFVITVCVAVVDS